MRLSNRAIASSTTNSTFTFSSLESAIPSLRQSNELLDSLHDDLNTPQAISVLHKIFKNCNDDDQNSIDLFINSAQFIGLMSSDPDDWLNWGKDSSIDEKRLGILIKKRDEARAKGNYDEADAIRSEIENMGIILEDKDGKTSWKLK